jgi:hypothetical protein
VDPFLKACQQAWIRRSKDRSGATHRSQCDCLIVFDGARGHDSREARPDLTPHSGSRADIISVRRKKSENKISPESGIASRQNPRVTSCQFEATLLWPLRTSAIVTRSMPRSSSFESILSDGENFRPWRWSGDGKRPRWSPPTIAKCARCGCRHGGRRRSRAWPASAVGAEPANCCAGC